MQLCSATKSLTSQADSPLMIGKKKKGGHIQEVFFGDFQSCIKTGKGRISAPDVLLLMVRLKDP